MPNFVLTQRAGGYRWVCPTCGYDQEEAYVLRSPREGEPTRPVPMRAGMRCEGLLGPVIGPQCLNCLAREDETAAVRLAAAAVSRERPVSVAVSAQALRDLSDHVHSGAWAHSPRARTTVSDVW